MWISEFELMKLLYIFCLSCFLLLNCTRPEPKVRDLKRIKEYFISLRFNVPFSSELMKWNDMELLAFTCTMMRLEYKQVLEILKKEDPKFYRIINASNAISTSKK